MSEPIGPGDFVLCVDASPSRNPNSIGFPCGLTGGMLYVVDSISVAPSGHRGVTVEGVIAPGAFGYWPDRFRLIHKRREGAFDYLLQPVDAVSEQETVR